MEAVAQGMDHVALHAGLPAHALGCLHGGIVKVVHLGGGRERKALAALGFVRGAFGYSPRTPRGAALLAIQESAPRGLRPTAPAFPGRLGRSDETAASAEACGHASSVPPSQRGVILRERARSAPLPSSCARRSVRRRFCLASTSNPTRGRIQSKTASL